MSVLLAKTYYLFSHLVFSVSPFAEGESMAFALPCHVIPARHGHERLRCLYSLVDADHLQYVHHTAADPRTPFSRSRHPNVGPCVVTTEFGVPRVATRAVPLSTLRQPRWLPNEVSRTVPTRARTVRALATHFVEEDVRYHASPYMHVAHLHS